jgi:prepilin-type N-terminal cleavage/methylation domain-containing protein
MKGEKGFTLIEVVVALAILGIIVAAFMAGLAGASRALFVADERATAESLARSQMEYIKSDNYSDSGIYNVLPIIPSGYSIYPNPIVADNVTVGLQKVTFTVRHDINSKDVITLEGYKGDR